jgi:hypothetical protein
MALVGVAADRISERGVSSGTEKAIIDDSLKRQGPSAEKLPLPGTV